MTTVLTRCPACGLERTRPRDPNVDLQRYVDYGDERVDVPCVVTIRQLNLHDVVSTWGVAPYGYGLVTAKTDDSVTIRWVDPVDGNEERTYSVQRRKRGDHFLRIEVDL